MPKVSVIIPAYNPGPYLKEALDSVVAQTFTDWECVVVDDGSTEDLSWVDGYAPGIRLIRQENAGVSVARNRGILETTGQYIAFLDADDYWTPEKLEKQTSLMNSDEGLGLSYHRYYYVNPSRNRTGDGPHADYHDYYTLLTECTISASTVMLRKEQLASTGIFDTSLRIGEDWSLWLMFARMSRLVGIDGEMAVYRIHAASATSDNKILYCGAIHMLCNKMRDAIRDRDKKAVKYIKSGMRKYRRIYAANEFDKARSYMSNKDIQMTIRKVLISLWNDPLFTLGSIWKWVVKRKIGASYNGNV